MNGSTSNLPVLVAGGGIGGVAAALALVRHRFALGQLPRGEVGSFAAFEAVHSLPEPAGEPGHGADQEDSPPCRRDCCGRKQRSFYEPHQPRIHTKPSATVVSPADFVSRQSARDRRPGPPHGDRAASSMRHGDRGRRF